MIGGYLMEEKKEEKTEEVPVLSPPVVLQKLPGAPTQQMIEQWKTVHGEVYMLALSEKEVFIWRPITRPEYLQVQQTVQNQSQYEELICDVCTLWRSVDADWQKGKAGTPATLHEQILLQSNFVNANAASLLVARL